MTLSAFVAGTAALPNRLVSGRPAPEETTQPFRLSHRRLAHPAGVVPGSVLAIGFAGAAAVFTLLPLHLLDIGSERAGTPAR